jgi:predicted HTH transcriptional regulator
MEILEKINQPESRKFELKRELPAPEKWLRTITAFANGAGGELVLGVDDKTRAITGVKDIFNLEEKITNTIHDSIRPPVSPYIYNINTESGQLLVVQILPGSQKPYYIASGGIERGVYVRFGSTSRLAGPAAIEELRREAIGVSFLDRIRIGNKNGDLDPEMLKWFFHKKLRIKRFTREHLLSYSILKRNNGDVLPTFLGMMLFGRGEALARPDFPNMGIKIGRYRGTDFKEIVSTAEFMPPWGNQIDRVVEAVLDALPAHQGLAGAARKKVPVLPPFAVREAIINALVHRDYSLADSGIQVHIFDDRCEIVSPGTLPDTLSLELLGQGISETRNRSLARLFRGADYMEELGSGIARMRLEMAEAGLNPPEFAEQAVYFRVILKYRASLPVDLQVVFKLLHAVPLSSSEIARKTGLHQNTVIIKLKQLAAQGLVQKTGAGRKVRYAVKPLTS